MTELTAADAKEMLLYVSGEIMDSKDFLCETDRKIGDGDHGIGMYNGMKKVKETLEKKGDTDNVYDVFAQAGKAMLMSMGGASGVIFSTLYSGGAKGMEPAESLSCADFAEFMARGRDAIQARGKAELGDKTMIDALTPAVEALRANTGEGYEKMLAAAEAAAADGVEKTKAYEAKFGRAKSLMDRAVGFQDAGATSVMLIFKAMKEFVEGK